MKRITNVKSRRRRGYESQLRDEQVHETRRKILEALVRTMARGVAGLSVPAVAREAGVSVPTVYRHFRTKASLVAALAPYLAEKTRLMEPPAGNGQSLADIAREMYRRNAAMDADVRAAMASQLGQELRERAMPRRIAMVREEVARQVPGLAREDLERFTRITLILMSSATLRAYKDYLGMGAADAAEDVAWALTALQRANRRGRT